MSWWKTKKQLRSKKIYSKLLVNPPALFSFKGKMKNKKNSKCSKQSKSQRLKFLRLVNLECQATEWQAPSKHRNPL